MISHASLQFVAIALVAFSAVVLIGYAVFVRLQRWHYKKMISKRLDQVLNPCPHQLPSGRVLPEPLPMQYRELS